MRLASYRDVKVPNFSVRILRDVLLEAGLDPSPVFRAAGLNPMVAQTPGAFVSGEQELAFQLKFVELTGDREDLWIRAGQKYSITAFGVRGLAILTSPTLAHFVNTLTSSELTFTLTDVSPLLNPDRAIIGFSVSYPEAPEQLKLFSIYRDTISMLQTVSLVTSATPFTLSRLHLPVPRLTARFQASIDSFTAAAPIVLGESSVRVEWDEEWTSSPLRFGDELQHESYWKESREQLERLRLEQEWARVVVSMIKESPQDVQLPKVASRLKLSTRTLHRRLEANGTTFRQLRDQALFELATDMLSQTKYSISEIARALGYEEVASFSVAFRRWSGQTPSQFRAGPSSA